MTSPIGIQSGTLVELLTQEIGALRVQVIALQHAVGQMQGPVEEPPIDPNGTVPVKAAGATG